MRAAIAIALLALMFSCSPPKPAPLPPPPPIQQAAPMVIVPTAGAPDCPELLPYCPGIAADWQLVKQDADMATLQAAYSKYFTWPPTCRFMQPPKCYTGQKRTCKQECTL